MVKTSMFFDELGCRVVSWLLSKCCVLFFPMPPKVERALTMSVDASVVGEVYRMFGFLALPSNVACWMPPVAHGV